MPQSPAAVSITRLQDGTITIFKGHAPRFWGGLGRGFSLPLGLGFAFGFLAWRIGAALGWYVRPLDAFVYPILVTGLGSSVLGLLRHLRRPERIELDWRREEVRLDAARGTTVIPFAEVAPVTVTSRWIEDAPQPLTFHVITDTAGQRLVLGEFDTEEAAHEWAAELNTLLGH